MARQYNQGRFIPRNPHKYAGNIHDICYRSGWELQLMILFDTNESIVTWNSEGLAIPYYSPVDGKRHRYFPDFLVRVKDKHGNFKTFLLEVKPHAQTQLRTQGRQTRKLLNETVTFVTNQAKWAAAEEFCKDQGWTFKVITEKDHSFI